MSDEQSRGDHLIALALAKKGDEGTIANDLLSSFQRGLPVERLKTLLDNEDPEIVRVGAWILSELGARGRPLLSYLPRFLENPMRWVRIYALDSALTCASPEDGGVVAAAVRLVEDADAGVRWQATQFLMRAPESLLRASDEILRTRLELSELHRALLVLLDGTESEARSLIESPHDVVRRFGLAAARRRNDEAALEKAKTATDQETKAFAERALEIMRRDKHWAERKKSSLSNP